MKNRLLFNIILFACIPFLYHCEQAPVRPEDEGAGQAAITGKLLKADGVTPASGALVTLLPRNTIAPVYGAAKKGGAPGKLLVKTQPDGTFSIDSCRPGLYALEGTDAEGNAVRIDSVAVTNPDMTTRLPDHSLKSTGALQGMVTLENDGDPGNVFILVFGSDRFMQVNSDGAFLMDNIPYGNYSLKIVCVQKGYGNSLTVPVRIQPGDTAVIDTIVLTATEICVPKNPTLQYDSIKMLVNLKWEPCSDKGVSSYNIYKYNNDRADQYPERPLAETPAGSEHVYIDFDVVEDHSYTYGIAAVSAHGNIGRKAGPLTVKTTSASFASDTIQYTADDGDLINVRWDLDGQLKVARTKSGKKGLWIDSYHSNLDLDSTSHIARDDISSITPYIVLIRNDYFIYKERSHWRFSGLHTDSIHCYFADGKKRYSVKLHKGDHYLNERNDTLYAEGAAFDTAGNMLFTYDESMRIVQATNGNLYAITHDYGLMQYTPETNTFSDLGIVDKRRQHFDVNAGLFHLYSYSKLTIYNTNGSLHARLRPDNFVFEYYSEFKYEKLSVDSSGRIAFIHDNRIVIILTPRQ